MALSTQGALHLAGSRLSARAGFRDFATRSDAPTLHESCLQMAVAAHSEPRCVDVVCEALGRDAENQCKKYGGAEPCVASARFHITLPRGPQHSKFCSRKGVSNIGYQCVDNGQLSPEDSTLPLGIRFNIQRLSKWFKAIDVKNTGKITQRELIVAFKRHEGMEAMFCDTRGIAYSDADQATSLRELPVQTRRHEVLRIKRILREVDTDGNGTMEWTEFVGFFRRAGLLLEYDDHPLNRTTLCTQAEVLHQQKEKAAAQKQRKDTIRRFATTRTYTSEMLDTLHVRRPAALVGVDLPLPRSIRGSLMAEGDVTDGISGAT